MDIMCWFRNLMRIFLMFFLFYHLFQRDKGKIWKAIAVLALSFLPWVLGLLNFHINKLTEVLYIAVIFMAIYLGAGWKVYDRFAWWDRLIHFLSGIMFFSLGVTLAQKAPDSGTAGALLFSFTLSLAAHVIWEVLEYLIDCISHSDHQRWQKKHPDINHLPDRSIQPAGLVDTMNDMIACVIGATIACVGWGIFLI